MHLPIRWWLAACVLVATIFATLLTTLAVGRTESPSPRDHVLLTGIERNLIGGLQVHEYQKLVVAHEVGDYIVTRAVGDYIAYRMFQDILSYVAVKEAEAAAAAAAQQAATAASTPDVSVTYNSGPPGGSATGDCYDGSPVPSYIIDRESGGNPNAVNPSSGAYGCYQELPDHFVGRGSCVGLNMYSVADQKTCAQRLIDGSGGTLLPWAETR